jgi:hypothetical protein
MPASRQELFNMIRTFTENAIGHDDEHFGRQLAAVLERHSLRLRAYFGGKPAWATSLRMYIRGSRGIED